MNLSWNIILKTYKIRLSKIGGEELEINIINNIVSELGFELVSINFVHVWIKADIKRWMVVSLLKRDFTEVRKIYIQLIRKGTIDYM